MPVILDNAKEHIRTSCDSFPSHSPTQGEFTRRGESACLSACRQIDHVSFPVWSVTPTEVIRLQYLTGHSTGAVQARGAHRPARPYQGNALYSGESLIQSTLSKQALEQQQKQKKHRVSRTLRKLVEFGLTMRNAMSELSFR